MGGAGPARRRAGMGRKARRLPEPRSVLDPWGFERALRILGWGPAPLVVATGFAQRLLIVVVIGVEFSGSLESYLAPVFAWDLLQIAFGNEVVDLIGGVRL